MRAALYNSRHFKRPLDPELNNIVFLLISLSFISNSAGLQGRQGIRGTRRGWRQGGYHSDCCRWGYGWHRSGQTEPTGCVHEGQAEDRRQHYADAEAGASAQDRRQVVNNNNNSNKNRGTIRILAYLAPPGQLQSFPHTHTRTTHIFLFHLNYDLFQNLLRATCNPHNQRGVYCFLWLFVCFFFFFFHLIFVCL